MIELLKYPKIRNGSHKNAIVRDVESHLSVKNYNYFKGETVTNTVHECTHGINSDLRNSMFPGERVNCFYLLEDRYFSFEEPNWGKRDVIPYIPSEYKSSSLYNIYVSGSNWSDRPLYLWDEWVAYCNGSMTKAKYSITNSIIFGYYAGAVLKKEMFHGLMDLAEWLVFRLYEVASKDQAKDLDRLLAWLRKN